MFTTSILEHVKGPKSHHNSLTRAYDAHNSTYAPMQQQQQSSEHEQRSNHDNDDDDWGEDTSDAAVEARLKGLSDAAKTLMLSEDQEKPEQDRIDIFYTFVKVLDACAFGLVLLCVCMYVSVYVRVCVSLCVCVCTYYSHSV